MLGVPAPDLLPAPFRNAVAPFVDEVDALAFLVLVARPHMFPQLFRCKIDGAHHSRVDDDLVHYPVFLSSIAVVR